MHREAKEERRSRQAEKSLFGEDPAAARAGSKEAALAVAARRLVQRRLPLVALPTLGAARVEIVRICGPWTIDLTDILQIILRSAVIAVAAVHLGGRGSTGPFRSASCSRPRPG